MREETFDDILDGEPTPITYRQLVIIESMIDRTSFSVEMKEDVLSNFNNYSEIEAEKIITQIFENEVKTNPKDQWEEMLKRNVFGNRDF